MKMQVLYILVHIYAQKTYCMETEYFFLNLAYFRQAFAPLRNSVAPRLSPRNRTSGATADGTQHGGYKR